MRTEADCDLTLGMAPPFISDTNSKSSSVPSSYAQGHESITELAKAHLRSEVNLDFGVLPRPARLLLVRVVHGRWLGNRLSVRHLRLSNYKLRVHWVVDKDTYSPLHSTLNSLFMRSTMISRCSSPIPSMVVCPVSSSRW